MRFEGMIDGSTLHQSIESLDESIDAFRLPQLPTCTLKPIANNPRIKVETDLKHVS